MTPAAPGVRLERASAGLGAGRSAAPVSRDSQPISMHGRAALPAGGIEIAGASATALNMPFPGINQQALAPRPGRVHRSAAYRSWIRASDALVLAEKPLRTGKVP
jgi:hypothetical protein